MNARVRAHIKRQLAKRTPEQIAADIEKLKELTRELRGAVKGGQNENQS